MKNRLLLWLLSVLYFFSYSYAYLEYVHPSFKYASYNYYPKDDIKYIFVAVICLIPTLFYRTSGSPSNFAAILIYSVVYVPGLSTFYFNWKHINGGLFPFLVLLCISMSVMFFFSRAAWRDYEVKSGLSALQKMIIHALYGIGLACMVFYYYDYMRLVGFNDVYELRFETNDLVQNKFVAYLFSWQTYVLIPFYYAYAVFYKKFSYFAVGFSGSILVYISSGSKAAILLPVLVVAISYIMRNRDFVFQRLLFYLICCVLIVTIFFPDKGVFLWAKSILLVRVLATNGWVLSKYYDYFLENGYTYYSHISFIDNVFLYYPYGDYSLGQLIGIKYSGNSLANFNANFLASDGVAALGDVGLLVATLFVCTFFVCLNYCARTYSSSLVILWLSGFWIALLNLPFFTAMISGGAVLVMSILLVKKLKLKRKD